MSRPWVPAAFVVLLASVPSCRCNGARPTTECIPLATPSGARDRAPETQLAALPRFARLWSREGFGAINGVGEHGVYYAISNDHRTVAAFEIGSGKSLWETTLPEPLGPGTELGIGQDAVIVVHRTGGEPERQPSEARVVRLDSRDGRVAWSKRVACAAASILRTMSRTFLACGLGPFGGQDKGEVLELDAQGNEVARVSVSGQVQAHASGALCGARQTEMWCGTIERGGLKTTWAHPAPEQAFVVHIAGDTVLAFGKSEVVARGVADGQSRWRREGRYTSVRGDSSPRVLLLDKSQSTLVNAADGAVLAQLGRFGTHAVRGRGEILIIDSGGPLPVRIVDGASSVREISANVSDIRHVDGNVMLARTAGVRAGEPPLEAFSLVSFAPPLDEAPARERVQGILERYPHTWQRKSAITELRRVPDWPVHLALVIDEGPSVLQEAAIAVAGESADPRFLSSLQKHLDRIGLPRDTAEWSRAWAVIEAVRDIDSPEAAAMLLALWQARRNDLGGSRLGTLLRDATAAATWRYGGQKEWVTCGDTAFPVVRVPPGAASIGTVNPILEHAVDRDRRWGVVCQAREDTDGNGKIEVVTLHHGEPGGDELRPYLVLGSGEGTVIDDFVADDPSGRWVVVTKDLCVSLVDTQTGKSVSLKGADGRQGDPVVGGHRAASFSPDGKSVLYIRTNGAHSVVVKRELRSGAERIIDPGAGMLVSAVFDGTGRWVVMDLVVSDSDGDGRLTWPRASSTLGARRCRGQAMSASFHGTYGDRPVRRFVPADEGTVEDAAADRCFEPVEIAKRPYQLEAQGRPDETEEKEVSRPGSHERNWPKVPLGPMVWKRR